MPTAPGWKHATVLGKAMDDLRDPLFKLPVSPTRMYYDEDIE